MIIDHEGSGKKESLFLLKYNCRSQLQSKVHSSNTPPSSCRLAPTPARPTLILTRQTPRTVKEDCPVLNADGMCQLLDDWHEISCNLRSKLKCDR